MLICTEYFCCNCYNPIDNLMEDLVLMHKLCYVVGCMEQVVDTCWQVMVHTKHVEEQTEDKQVALFHFDIHSIHRMLVEVGMQVAAEDTVLAVVLLVDMGLQAADTVLQVNMVVVPVAVDRPVQAGMDN